MQVDPLYHGRQQKTAWNLYQYVRAPDRRCTEEVHWNGYDAVDGRVSGSSLSV